MMRFTRTDNSLLAEWWHTIDRRLLVTLLMLIGVGLVMSLAASPAIAVKKGLPAFHFVERHVVFASVSAVVMLIVSLLGPRHVRRLALGLMLVAILGMMAVLVVGAEINGARRWISVMGLSLQPSELAKPGFVVASAWLLVEARRSGDAIALMITVAFYVAIVALLVAQPDLGQTLLVSLVWGTLFFLSGQPLRWAAAFGVTALVLFGTAALTFDHARQRIVRFIAPSSGETYQTDRALQSFAEGGLLGRGPGEGTIKTVLPDAHTDFIFAVIAEEFGAVACLFLVGLYAFVLMRAFARARTEPDAFTRLAVMGLALLIVVQAVINMGVNVGLLPAKGMTLPFVSAGGSSSLGTAIAAGLLLALMRRRTDVAHVKLPQPDHSLMAAR